MAVMAALILITSFMLRPDISEWRRGPAELSWIEPAPQDLHLRRPVLGEEIRSARSPPLPGQAAQFFLLFDRSDLPDQPLGLLIPASGGATTNVYLNGAPLFPPYTQSGRHLLHQGGHSLFIPLDESFFHRGQNRIDIVVAGQTNRALAGSVYLGPQAGLSHAFERFVGAFPEPSVLILAGGLAAILSLTAAALRKPRRTFVIAGLIAANIALLASAGHWAGIGLPLLLTLRLERLLLAVLLFALTSWLWANAGGGKLSPRLLAGTALLTMAGFVVSLIQAIERPEIGWWFGAVGIVFPAFLLAMVFVHRIRAISGLAPGLALPAWLASLTGFAATLAALGLIPASGLLMAELVYRLLLFVFLGIILGASVHRIIRETRHLLAHGFDQAALIAAQREEIAEKTSALAQEERRRAILEERQRLLRDMHDGVGGQLVSLLVRIRGNNLPKKEIEADLRSGLTDLRLIVDSLDTAGDSLPGALMAFHDRAAPQAEAAGIELKWQQSEVPDTGISEPRALLNLYRWMQEALANAIRHANASRVRISVNASGAHLTVTVEDDGSGLPQDVLNEHRSGKGLKSMQARAREMGGDSVCTSANLPSGTRCELRLPMTAFGLD